MTLPIWLIRGERIKAMAWLFYLCQFFPFRFSWIHRWRRIWQIPWFTWVLWEIHKSQGHRGRIVKVDDDHDHHFFVHICTVSTYLKLKILLFGDDSIWLMLPITYGTCNFFPENWLSYLPVHIWPTFWHFQRQEECCLQRVRWLN